MIQTRAKTSQLYKISKEAKYVPPLALKCRLRLSKEIEHLIACLNNTNNNATASQPQSHAAINRNAIEWLSERFRDLVPPKKLVTLKQVKEINLNETSEHICVDLFVNQAREDVGQLLLMDSLNELSRENKTTLKHFSSIAAPAPFAASPSVSATTTTTSAAEIFDCRILEAKVSIKINLIELKVIPFSN